ncbi:hypothetical protein L6452_02192 [Arctium lappa]|uniref:Uncharacterized protein n=1 Tax=Arctium lappa TaxID=4217 RepID=A0ACB9FJQ2_ARCLA|nr:hypothetical protein L6452_02192 [Arctium lappa]
MKSLPTDKEKEKSDEKSNLEKLYNQKLSDFSKKALQEKNDLEHRCLKLSKQVSDFEKILITERDTFAKERKVLDEKIEKKKSEKRNVGIFNEISAKNKNLEKEFELERQNFENEISKLSRRLTGLSSIMSKEQKARSDLQVKFDTILEEKNLLSKKIKDLEVANVELSEKIYTDVIDQSPLDKSTESVCSFKTASSFISEKVSRKNSVKPKTVDTS